MSNNHLWVLAGLLAAAPAFAQPGDVLGKTSEVLGLVTVSNGAVLTNATAGSPIVDGSRYVTTSGSSATLTLDNGCVLRMQPNQSITITSTQTCDEMLALLETSSRNLLAMATPSAGGTGMTALLGLGALAGLGLVRSATQDRPISGQ